MTDEAIAQASVEQPVVAEAQPAPTLTVDEAAALVATAPSEPAAVATEEPQAEPEPQAASPETQAIAMEVTELGAGAIFKGEVIGGIEQTFAAGERFSAGSDIADIHESRGLAVRV